MDNVCIICREEMVTGAKRLPCNHIFHTRCSPGGFRGVPGVPGTPRPCGVGVTVLSLRSCLRSWFQRQQTCPTCRMDVLRASLPAQPPPEPPEPAPAPAQTPQGPQPPNCE